MVSNTFLYCIFFNIELTFKMKLRTFMRIRRRKKMYKRCKMKMFLMVLQRIGEQLLKKTPQNMGLVKARLSLLF